MPKNYRTLISLPEEEIQEILASTEVANQMLDLIYKEQFDLNDTHSKNNYSIVTLMVEQYILMHPRPGYYLFSYSSSFSKYNETKYAVLKANSRGEAWSCAEPLYDYMIGELDKIEDAYDDDSYFRSKLTDPDVTVKEFIDFLVYEDVTSSLLKHNDHKIETFVDLTKEKYVNKKYVSIDFKKIFKRK